MEKAKIIARYVDGRLEKGFTHGFNPNRPSFFLNPAGDVNKSVQINLKDLKAIFFVRTFEGDPDYNEDTDSVEGVSAGGRKCEVLFQDKEVMRGTTVGYSRERPGFFLFPTDPKSNNERIFVISSAIRSFRYI